MGCCTKSTKIVEKADQESFGPTDAPAASIDQKADRELDERDEESERTPTTKGACCGGKSAETPQ